VVPPGQPLPLTRKSHVILFIPEETKENAFSERTLLQTWNGAHFKLDAFISKKGI